MFEGLGSSRKLPFPLYNQVTNGNITDNAGIEGETFQWPEDSTERVIFPLYISLDEYVALSSAIDVGSDIAYPLQYAYIMWIWMRQERFSVNICALIAECIANSEATQDALRDFISNDTVINNHIENTVEGLVGQALTGPLVYGSCDPSIVAGKMLALVDRLDTNNKDALELIEVGTNDEEKVAALLEGIPVLGELPIGDIIDFGQDVLEDFEEGYAGISTIERREALAEDLYCLAQSKPDCSLSYADLFEFFQFKVGSGLTLDSLVIDVVDFIRDGDFNTDDLVWYGMFALQIAMIRVGKEFFGINAPKIGSLTRDALPSTIWEEWDECADPETRTPVINSLWDEPNIAGTLSGPDESGFYTVTATSRGTDFAFVLMDIDERTFVLTDITYSFRPQCQVLINNTEVLYIGCSGTDVYTGQIVDEYWSTWTNAQGAHTMQFKMVAP